MKKRTAAAIAISVIILLFTLTKTKNRLAITLIWMAIFAAAAAAFAYFYRKKLLNKGGEAAKAPDKQNSETRKTITEKQQPQQLKPQPKPEQKPQQTTQKHRISAEKFRQIKEKHDRMNREEVLGKLRSYTRRR